MIGLILHGMINRYFPTLVFLGVAILVLFGCGGAPSEKEANKDTAPSTASSTTGSTEPPMEALPLSRDELLGTWQTQDLSEEAKLYRYEFRPDGTFAVYGLEGGELLVQGRYALSETDRELRLYVRDPSKGEVVDVARLRALAKKGEGPTLEEILLEQLPDHGTLWLRRPPSSSNF